MRVTVMVLCSLLLFACSRKSPQELYTEGTKAIETKEYRIAADRFEEILANHPHETVAESALYRTALLYNNELHDIPKAVGYFERYHDAYPASQHAPTALFLTGFLLNNDMHDIGRAKEAYTKFLREYPTHDLASSARFELENLGKDPGLLAPAAGAGEPDSAAGRATH